MLRSHFWLYFLSLAEKLGDPLAHHCRVGLRAPRSLVHFLERQVALFFDIRVAGVLLQGSNRAAEALDRQLQPAQMGLAVVDEIRTIQPEHIDRHSTPPARARTVGGSADDRLLTETQVLVWVIYGGIEQERFLRLL